MKLVDVKKIAVLGADTMGPGIARIYATGGIEVNLCDVSETNLEKAKFMLCTNLNTVVEEDLLTIDGAKGVLGRISYFCSVPEAVNGVFFLLT
ncbi:MAG: 3-hydroxyacyl-CoA dehydrogenase NAD-binding domain-containing protein [Negativicutes bacterium]